MEYQSHDNYFNSLMCFAYTLGLTIFGEIANLFKSNSDIVGMITVLFQWFAWGGAGVLGVIAVIKFLQDNGFVRKGKPKK